MEAKTQSEKSGSSRLTLLIDVISKLVPAAAVVVAAIVANQF